MIFNHKNNNNQNTTTTTITTTTTTSFTPSPTTNDFVIEGDINYDIPVNVESKTCNIKYKMTNAKYDGGIYFNITIMENENAHVLIRAENIYDEVLNIKTNEKNNFKFDCFVGGDETNSLRDLYIKVFILDDSEYINFLKKEKDLDNFDFGISSINLYQLKN